jgi:hypothetical protein
LRSHAMAEPSGQAGERPGHVEDAGCVAHGHLQPPRQGVTGSAAYAWPNWVAALRTALYGPAQLSPAWDVTRGSGPVRLPLPTRTRPGGVAGFSRPGRTIPMRQDGLLRGSVHRPPRTLRWCRAWSRWQALGSSMWHAKALDIPSTWYVC